MQNCGSLTLYSILYKPVTLPPLPGSGGRTHLPVTEKVLLLRARREAGGSAQVVSTWPLSSTGEELGAVHAMALSQLRHPSLGTRCLHKCHEQPSPVFCLGGCAVFLKHSANRLHAAKGHTNAAFPGCSLHERAATDSPTQKLPVPPPSRCTNTVTLSRQTDTASRVRVTAAQSR